MAMRVLFLDIDGVLNSHDWFKLRRKEAPTGASQSERLVRDLDPRAVGRLNIIMDQTDASCVLSSTWRTGFGLDATREALSRYGFEKRRLISATPDFAMPTESGLFVGARRGSEIQAWLNEHPECDSFAIVDDDSDMGPLLPRLVATSMAYGLTDSEMVRLIYRLSR